MRRPSIDLDDAKRVNSLRTKSIRQSEPLTNSISEFVSAHIAFATVVLPVPGELLTRIKLGIKPFLTIASNVSLS
ncbi:hypothetical protein CJ20_307 [Escherichia phage CJ20]|nr:hypothetical protein CJ20_307 [Escherichia phage CJ20]